MYVQGRLCPAFARASTSTQAYTRLAFCQAHDLPGGEASVRARDSGYKEAVSFEQDLQKPSHIKTNKQKTPKAPLKE